MKRSRSQRNRSDEPQEVHQFRTPEERAQHITDAIEKKLNLTADQKAKVCTINLEHAERIVKTMKSDREFRKSQIEKRKSYMEELIKN